MKSIVCLKTGRIERVKDDVAATRTRGAVQINKHQTDITDADWMYVPKNEWRKKVRDVK